MNTLLKILVVVGGVLFTLMGLRWLVDPAGVAGQLGMPLLDGVGRSTQVGDLFAFFVTLALFIWLAFFTGRRAFYYPAICLLAMAALGRTLAWLFHGAAFSPDSIAVEVVFAVILFVASKRLATRE